MSSASFLFAATRGAHCKSRICFVFCSRFSVIVCRRGERSCYEEQHFHSFLFHMPKLVAPSLCVSILFFFLGWLKIRFSSVFYRILKFSTCQSRLGRTVVRPQPMCRGGNLPSLPIVYIMLRLMLALRKFDPRHISSHRGTRCICVGVTDRGARCCYWFQHFRARAVGIEDHGNIAKQDGFVGP